VLVCKGNRVGLVGIVESSLRGPFVATESFHMVKRTVTQTVADAVVQAEVASVKAVRRAVGAVQRKVEGMRKGGRKLAKGTKRTVAKTKRAVRKTAKKVTKRKRSN
jgi:hypothetical protein